MDFQVIDDFLPSNQIRHIQDSLIGVKSRFPWNYNGDPIWGRDPESTKSFQFTQIVYDARPNTNPFSDAFPLVEPCLMKLGAQSLRRVKANLTTKTLFHRNEGWHTDYPPSSLILKTAILYINTNNGYTKFKKSGKIVKSVANRTVIFPSDLEHAGFSCTDKKVRVLINFNYG